LVIEIQYSNESESESVRGRRDRESVRGRRELIIDRERKIESARKGTTINRVNVKRAARAKEREGVRADCKNERERE